MGRRRSVFGLAFVVALVAAVAFAQVAGSLTGVISGPSGPLGNVTVNVLNATGQVVGSTTTNAAGRYDVGNLAMGTYTVQVLSNGAVLATGTGTVSAAAAAATVNISLTAAQLAPAGIAAAGGGGLSTVAILGIAAGAAVGIGTAIALSGDPSATQ